MKNKFYTVVTIRPVSDSWYVVFDSLLKGGDQPDHPDNWLIKDYKLDISDLDLVEYIAL